MLTRIAVLSRHSIFGEGIERRLREHPKQLEVHHIDPGAPDYLEKIKHIQPSAVLLDSSSASNAQCCCLCELLLNFPSIMIVRLTIDQQDVQVIHSSSRQFTSTGELMDVFDSHI